MEMKFLGWKDKILTVIIYLYLFLPIMIFLFGWCKLWLAIPGTVIISVSFVLAVKKAGELKFPVQKRKDIPILIVAAFIIGVWVVLSGVGGAVWQNGDHAYRNAIFNALVELPWPAYKNIIVGDGNQLRPLVYYIGFWLPSAVGGKQFGLFFGYCFQIIWATSGLFLVYLLLCIWRKKVVLSPLFILIFFSGLDFVGINLLNNEPIPITTITHLENWTGLYQFSSNTTQLFWVFNQAIPAWLVIMLLWNQRSKENFVFASSTLVISSPFSFIGLLPIVFCFSIMGEKWNEVKSGIKKYLKKLLSFQNIFGGGFIGLLSYMYLKSNVALSNTIVASPSVNNVPSDGNDLGVMYTSLYERNLLFPILIFLLFFLLEAGIYLLLIWHRHKKDLLYYVVAICLLLIPFIKVGEELDFCMRASIPALFVLMLYVIEMLEEELTGRGRTLLLLVLIIGALTPISEIHRTLVYTKSREAQTTVALQDLFGGANFSGNSESFFFKKLAKPYINKKKNDGIRIMCEDSAMVSQYIYYPSSLSRDEVGRYITSGGLGITVDLDIIGDIELNVDCILPENDIIIVNINGETAGIIYFADEHKLEIDRQLLGQEFQNIFLMFGYMDENGNFIKEENPVYIQAIELIIKG